MEILARIAAFSSVAFGVILVVLQLIAHELGYHVGRWHASKAPVQEESAGWLAGGVLALLAFVLALTLSFANERFAATRGGTLAETNAISTAWIRAEAIGQPEAGRIAELLQPYARLRMEFVRAPDDPKLLARINDQTSILQSRILEQLALLVHRQPTAISNSLMAALNEVFDAASSERFAFGRRIPARIYWLLLVLTLTGMAVLGYRIGVKGTPARALALILAAVWALVIVDIVDLGTPRIGDIRPGIAPYDTNGIKH